MTRPLSQGPDIIMADIQSLNRMLRRVQQDRKRYPQEREALIRYLKGVITILMHGERANSALESAVQAAPKRRAG